jgi:hypothetical protein
VSGLLAASGSHSLTAGRTVTVTARLTRRGRAMLLAALHRRRHRTVPARVYVNLPGVRTQRRALLLVP